MSAICGYINLKGAAVDIENARAMIAQMERYPAEYSELIVKDNYFLGCRHRAVTKEAEFEKLPIRDGCSGLVLTADAVIDNRLELLKFFNIPSSECDEINDSQLILLAYKKWNKDCPKYLIGDYAFAIYNEQSKELFCARDHIGKRTFYFYYTHEFFAFSTTIEPLFYIDGIEKTLNESWIAYALSFNGTMHEVYCDQTVYEGIMQLLPANTLIVKLGGIHKEQYWSPLTRQELKLKTDEEYEEAFRQVFFTAVKDRIRTNGDVGIMLSGGLDSGSIACVAASQLENQKKTLKAYCSVPFKDYLNYLPNSRVADETRYVEAIKGKYKNIDLKLMQFNGKNTVFEIEELLRILEQPYKTIENLYWINDIAQYASENGCKILLSGQLGNMSISYGIFSVHLNTLLRKYKLLTIIKEIRAYSSLWDVSSIGVAKNFLKRNLPRRVKKLYGDYNDISMNKAHTVLVNPVLAAKYNTYENLLKLGITNHSTLHNIHELRETMSNPRNFSQIGMIETKVSLNSGLQIRDPSGDKRVIEFCFSVPPSQYVKNGNERYLIRRAMHGILPDEVRLNYKERGYQSADWIQRLVPIWMDVKEELQQMVRNENFKHYIDSNVIIKALEEIGEISGKKYSADVRMLIMSLVFGRFMQSQ